MTSDPAVSLASSIQAGPGAYALLVGSGVSREAGVPTGWEVALDLIRRFAIAGGQDPGDDLLGWYRRNGDGEPDYSALLEQVATSREDRRNLLESYFEPTDDERDEGVKMPTAAHRAIAELVKGGYLKVIVTTNFDRLLELALAEVDVAPTVISSPAHAEGALPLVHSGCTIIKVHGDYLSPDLKNTVEELDGYAPAIDALLDRVFDEYGLVVCGWSARWDTALRNAVLRAPNRRFATYWMHRDNLTDQAQELIAHRKAIPMQITNADTEFDTLSQTVAALAERADQQPQGTAAAVARLKRYLPDPTHRIRLSDLISTETVNLIKQVAGLPVAGDDVGAIYEQRIRAYEEASVRLATLLAVGARFSDNEQHDQLWADTVDRLANRPLAGSGKTHLINMQQYPTLLAMYALALGSAAANRLEPIARVLGTITTEVQNYRTPIAAAVNAWTVFNRDVFKRHVEGFERAGVPVSTNLFRVLRPIAAEFEPDDRRYETLFDEVEYLFGITYGIDSAEGAGPVGRGAFRTRPSGEPPTRLATLHRDLWIRHGVFENIERFDACSRAYNARYRNPRSRWL